MWKAHALSKTFVSSLHSHLLYIDQAFIAFDPSIIRRHKVLRLLLCSLLDTMMTGYLA